MQKEKHPKKNTNNPTMTHKTYLKGVYYPVSQWLRPTAISGAARLVEPSPKNDC
jgi:hypothetical protein